MFRSGSKRLALRLTAAAAVTAAVATSLGSGVAYAAPAPVLKYQQQWNGAATSRTGNNFLAPQTDTMLIGGSCGATGDADAGQVGLFDVTEGNELEAVSQVFPCTNQIYRKPVPVDPGHVYKMVIKTDGVSPSQGVYAWQP